MPQVLDFNNLGNYKQLQADNTELYRRQLIESGMNELTPDEFILMLSNLGYKIDKSMCFTYYNNLNEQHYKARSMYYTDIKRKQSAFHFEQSFTNADNLAALQKIRLNNFVYDFKNIWEL